MVTAFVWALAVQSQEPSARTPARWSLQVAPARCFLERFDPESASTLSIDTMPGSDSYRVSISGNQVSTSASSGPGTLVFGPDRRSITGFAVVAKLPSDVQVVWMQGLRSSLLDDLAGASTLTIATKAGAKVSMPFTGADKAVAAMRQCDRDQLVEWGADPAQFAPGGMSPVATTARDEWLSDASILRFVGLSKRRSVDDGFRLTVATDGTIQDCWATSDVTEPELEKAACAAVTGRRLFSPARDAAGAAVRGAATFNVTFSRQGA